jgi:hypothetical protein
MKTCFKGLFATLLALASATALAIPITDIVDPTPDPLITVGSPYSFVHDITDNGYNPLTQTITSALLTVSLYDKDTKGNETFQFLIGSGGTSQTYSDSNVDNGAAGADYAISLVAALADLQADGKLNVQLSAQTGDFVFTQSKLEAQVSTRSAAVPEPGILALLGIGVLGVGAALRKKV